MGTGDSRAPTIPGAVRLGRLTVEVYYSNFRFDLLNGKTLQRTMSFDLLCGKTLERTIVLGYYYTITSS